MRMSREHVDAFIAALGRLEQDGDSDSLVSLFADDCDVGNVTSQRRFEGRDRAREFWTEYRSQLGDVRSRFRSVIVEGDRAALEWETTGGAVAYGGVSILEFADGRIARFDAYFDPAHLGRQVQANP